jgi:hypothetical protein
MKLFAAKITVSASLLFPAAIGGVVFSPVGMAGFSIEGGGVGFSVPRTGGLGDGAVPGNGVVGFMDTEGVIGFSRGITGFFNPSFGRRAGPISSVVRIKENIVPGCFTNIKARITAISIIIMNIVNLR